MCVTHILLQALITRRKGLHQWLRNVWARNGNHYIYIRRSMKARFWKWICLARDSHLFILTCPSYLRISSLLDPATLLWSQRNYGTLRLYLCMIKIDYCLQALVQCVLLPTMVLMTTNCRRPRPAVMKRAVEDPKPHNTDSLHLPKRDYEDHGTTDQCPVTACVLCITFILHAMAWQH